jgi:exosome complex RNA-binding protein Csl4
MAMACRNCSLSLHKAPTEQKPQSRERTSIIYGEVQTVRRRRDDVGLAAMDQDHSARMSSIKMSEWGEDEARTQKKEREKSKWRR